MQIISRRISAMCWYTYTYVDHGIMSPTDEMYYCIKFRSYSCNKYCNLLGGTVAKSGTPYLLKDKLCSENVQKFAYRII